MTESIATRRRGRPAGERRRALLSWASQIEGSFTCRAAKDALNLPMAVVDVTLRRAVDNGQLKCVGTAAVAWAKRPVAQYEVARDGHDLMGAMHTWVKAGDAQTH